MLFENGSIRYISAGKNEIIRMIYAAVRDKEWLTIKPVITKEIIERLSDSFKIQYTCSYKSAGIDFNADYTIEGKSDNTIIFTLEGKALGSFEKNRIGFCVLHPVEGCAGNLCTVTHSDGGSETAVFPLVISPDQPFTDIKAMQWKTGEVECHLEFSGDIFETEDQRNWTDASYKTYSTPLSLPFPVKIEKGQKIYQKIVLKVENTGQNLTEKQAVIHLSFNTASSLPVPEIGIGRSTRNIPLEENEIEILKTINFDHYRCDLYLFYPGWKEIAKRSAEEASELGYSQELVLFFDDDYKEQSSAFSNWMAESGIVPRVITIFHKTVQVTPAYLTEYVTLILRKAVPEVKICIGTNANFAQLNMDRLVTLQSDLVCYSCHPQEHASDNTTLIENLQALAHTVKGARIFSEGRGVWLSPVNIQRRFNANIENYETPASSDTLPQQVDSRMMSLFGACWTAGSLKYLCESGVSGITYYEAAGERGIIQGDYDSRWPDDFKSGAGMIFPVYHIFKWFLEDKSYRIIRSRSSSPLKVDVLAMLMESKIRFVLINYGHNFQNVTISINTGTLNSFTLETESFSAAASDPDWITTCNMKEIHDLNNLPLSPFSVTFMEGNFVDQNHNIQ
jgi:hypothetical protein